MNYRYKLATQRYAEIDVQKHYRLHQAFLAHFTGDPMYTVRIYANETYHLYKDGETQAIPFRELLRIEDAETTFPLQKKHGNAWEHVGDIRLKDLLLMTPDTNPLFDSLKRSRVKYQWRDFERQRKAKYGL